MDFKTQRVNRSTLEGDLSTEGIWDASKGTEIPRRFCDSAGHLVEDDAFLRWAALRAAIRVTS